MPTTRHDASIVHVDLDAFFAAVEQRDKPSLRGKPVVVGGTGSRGVVSTASYEARRYGARSAMPTQEARRRCPAGTAFLAGRHAAYRISSEVVMEVLRSTTPVVEQVSVDEAFLDLAAAGPDGLLTRLSAEEVGAHLRHEIVAATGGLSASVGLARSKMLAKIASEMAKPAGVHVVPPGREREVLAPMSVRVISGVGPATERRLRGFGVETVADLARVQLADLVSIFGEAHGASLHALARAQDPREVTTHRSSKSISAEETFPTDVADPATLATEVERLSGQVARRLEESHGFARTITVKARWHDFRTVTRSGSLPFATGDPVVISREATRLLATIETADGLRLLGVGVSGLTSHAQGELELEATLTVPTRPTTTVVDHPDAGSSPETDEKVADGAAGSGSPVTPAPSWATGADVRHERHGRGWVWGSGAGIVTVRFEGPRTPPGRIRTFDVDDPELAPAEPPDWRG
ncbi:MAG TPA: DNA polymerase IV [Ornithinimicrobium sp.]|uniref:DNA polymerase IV n=1 Tax=Ornithinimicrobium sp. TaxID=1977084 RepID=UPI002B46DEDD|nr:DNA polymerase IV [Ornithinimicrobium sp.]HKJ12947.1 DNA polymerase IV [Ornithinimicrobium sp.]